MLWAVSLFITVGGYLIMSSSDSSQAAFYTDGGDNYADFFPAQSGSTLGGILIAVGLLGVLFSLSVQVITRTRQHVEFPVIETSDDYYADSLEEEDDDDENEDSIDKPTGTEETNEKAAANSER